MDAALNLQVAIAMPRIGNRPPLNQLAMFFAAYFGAAGFTEALAGLSGPHISMWPAAGIYIAVLLVTPMRSWPWWMLAASAGELVANAIWYGHSAAAILLFCAGNAGSAFAGALLFRFVAKADPRLRSPTDVVVFILLCAGLAPFASATAGSAALALSYGQPLFAAWQRIWLGDATGILVTAPFVLALTIWPRPRLLPKRVLEAAFLTAVFAGASMLSLTGQMRFAYILMPIHLWTAARFQLRGAAFMSVMLTALTAAFTVAGVSPFSGSNETAVDLQLFLAISAIGGLLVAAVAEQHREALRRLYAANKYLERRVDERTSSLKSSETRYRLALKAANASSWTWDLTVQQVSWDDRVGALYDGLVEEISSFERWLAVVHPDDRGRIVDRLQVMLNEPGEDQWAEEFRSLDREGNIIWHYGIGQAARNAAGAVVRLAGIDINITERKAMETKIAEAVDALARGRERLAAATMPGKLGVYEWDIAADCLWWAPETYDLYGVDADSFLPTRDSVDSLVHPDDRSVLWHKTAQAITNRDPFSHEFRVVQRDGTVRWLANHSHVGCDNDGVPQRVVGVAVDITEQRIRQDQVQLLLHEVTHRAKNVLSVVQAIARQSADRGQDAFLDDFDKRIAALAASHDLLVQTDWSGVEVEALARAQLAQFCDAFGMRIYLDGPAVRLNAGSTQTLGLVFHELASNARKFGSLSNESGEVSIAWRRAPSGSFRMSWRERGGPPVQGPRHRGFGSVVLREIVQSGLNGKAELEYAIEGVHWEMNCPLDAVLHRDTDTH